MAKQF